MFYLLKEVHPRTRYVLISKEKRIFSNSEQEPLVRRTIQHIIPAQLTWQQFVPNVSSKKKQRALFIYFF